jgi:hypothetical protein
MRKGAEGRRSDDGRPGAFAPDHGLEVIDGSTVPTATGQALARDAGAVKRNALATVSDIRLFVN